MKFIDTTVLFSHYREKRGIAEARMMVSGKVDGKKFSLSCKVARALVNSHDPDGGWSPHTLIGLGGGSTEFTDVVVEVQGRKVKDAAPYFLGCCAALSKKGRTFAAYVSNRT